MPRPHVQIRTTGPKRVLATPTPLFMFRCIIHHLITCATPTCAWIYMRMRLTVIETRHRATVPIRIRRRTTGLE